MLKISATFLVLLIVPFALCNTSYLEKIQKTPEGQHILNTIFLQSKILGAHLDVNTVRSIISGAVQDIDNNAGAHDGNNQYAEDCNADLKELRQNLAEANEKENLLERHLSSATRLQKRQQTVSERAQEEHDNYSRFQAFISANKEAWTHFYENTVANLKKINGLLHDIGEALAHITQAEANAVLHSAEGVAGFIQIPKAFKTALTQVQVKFHGGFRNMEGLKPIISNLLEIMQDDQAIVRQSVRQSIRRVFESLSEKIRDRIEQLETENENELSLFDNLEKAFKANAARTQANLDINTNAANKLQEKIGGINGSITFAHKITQTAQEIYDLRNQECKDVEVSLGHINVKKSKIHGIAQEIRDIIDNKFPVLQAFLQKYQIQRTSS